MTADRFGHQLHAREYVAELTACLSGLPLDKIDRIMRRIARAAKNGKAVYVIGNGGSATTALHMAADFRMMRIPGVGSEKKQNIRALLDNTALFTAYANDVSYEDVFVEQLKGIAKKGDMLIALSVSGNSPNIVKALEYGRNRGMETVGLFGHHLGGRSASIVDHVIVVPSISFGICEDVHLILEHLIVSGFRKAKEYGDTADERLPPKRRYVHKTSR